MTREELLSRARRHMWAAWSLSSEELASQAADTLMGLGMLVPEGGAAELVRLRARVAELETGRQADHETWQHDLRTARNEREATAVRIAALEAERHVTNEALDDAVQALRARESASVARSADRLTAFFGPTQAALREDSHEGPLRHSYLISRDLPETGGA